MYINSIEMCDIFCREDKLYASARIHDLRYYRRVEKCWFTVKIILSLTVSIICISAVGACFYYYPQEWTYLFWFGSGVAFASLIILWICFCLINRRINMNTVHHMRTQVSTTPPDEDAFDDLDDEEISSKTGQIAQRISGALASCTYASGVPVTDTKPIMRVSSAPSVVSPRISVYKVSGSSLDRDKNSYEDLTMIPAED